MHMSDALLSPAVAAVAAGVTALTLAVAVRKVRADGYERSLPLMGVMGAFIFAAQMLNFTIPATGSSGHIVGGVLLGAVLGPWAGLITLTSVLVVQSLIFADGGLMALGCNVFNMAVLNSLVAYPFIFRPLMRASASKRRTMVVSILACVTGLLMGAAAVTVETQLSGITALPTVQFLGFMLPIHLVIGLVEGVATGAVLCSVHRLRPQLLFEPRPSARRRGGTAVWTLVAIGMMALVMGGIFSFVASAKPDGLEWSILKTAGREELHPEFDSAAYAVAEQVQQSTAVMPDYNTTFAGIVGSGAILLVAFGISYLIRSVRRRP